MPPTENEMKLFADGDHQDALPRSIFLVSAAGLNTALC